MDGDPFAKAMDRIRLIGRLFFKLVISGHFPRGDGHFFITGSFKT